MTAATYKSDMSNQNLPARTISRHAYNAFRPKLSGSRRLIVEALGKYGPLTANQVVAQLPPSDLSNNNVRSRLTELVRMGAATVNAVVRDPVSGHMARHYRLLLPGETPSTTPDELIRRSCRAQREVKITRLRTENEALESSLRRAAV
jgi:predicted ArsR family transcriptional regulator